MYSFPAGHAEQGESVRAAAIREAKEEVGITLEPESLTLFHVAHWADSREDGERLSLFFYVKRWDGEPTNAEPEKCDDVQWVGLKDLPENMVPKARRAVEAMVSGEVYSEKNWLS
jgi:ADP-ribose pyrophosphatase YjhB (NUDIX family)